MIEYIWDWIHWYFWEKWKYKWKHRNDTPEECIVELKKQWNNYLDASKEEPAIQEKYQAIKAFDDLESAFNKDKDEDDSNDL